MTSRFFSIFQRNASRSYVFSKLDDGKGVRVRSRTSLWLSFVSFLTLETTYLSLALFCYHHPIAVDSNANNHTQAEFKALFTTVFILWQTIALSLVSGLLIKCFSSEWVSTLSRDEALKIGVTDQVSVLTSGIWERLRHLRRRKSTITFKISLVLSFVILGLSGFGPGCITLGSSLANDSSCGI
jgi:hypothetical protein